MKLEDKTLFDSIEREISGREVALNKRAVEYLEDLLEAEDLSELKGAVARLKGIVSGDSEDTLGVIGNEDAGGIRIKIGGFAEVLDKILLSQTIERAKHYVNSAIKMLSEERTGKINDINLNRWRDYSDIITDSLWILPKRDTTGVHSAWYWGNFVPQIPNQFIRRYTKRGEWVLDPFLGSGTTLIECKRLGRNGIGVEINDEVARRAKELIDKETDLYGVTTEVIVGNSRRLDFKEILKKSGISKVQLIILHPPYWDIIKFSDKEEDLSNTKSLREFIEAFGEVVDNIYPVLENGRFMVLVIGDKYSRGEWIPLGFYLMEEVLKRNFLLKSIIVKNFEDTRAKKNQKELWRYRALVGGFYVFKHEYIFLFQKKR